MTVQPEYVVVIPARLESQRLPGKVLLAETGMPLIQHVVEIAQSASGAGNVHVLAEGERFADMLWSVGLPCKATPPARNGMERIGRCLLDAPPHLFRDDTIIVHLQADEPEFPSEAIPRLAKRVAAHPLCDFATAVTRTPPSSPGPCVQPILDRQGFVTRFLRHDVPAAVRHCGAYAYRAGFAKWYASLDPTPNETAASLEQLRALDNGARCAAVEVDHAARGIDTRQDYDEFVARWRAAHP